MTTNERLAKWAGWVCIGGIWICPKGGAFSVPPAYDASLDLLRRDVLTRLSEEQRESLNYHIAGKYPLVTHYDQWAKVLLTIPASDLAAAVAEVIES